MKIVFVNPPSPDPNYGVYREECCVGLRREMKILPAMLAWMAGIARKKHKVDVIDFAVENGRTLPVADMYVVAVNPFILRHDLKIIKHIKKEHPKCKIAVVVQPPVFKEWITTNYPVDFFIDAPRIKNFMKLVQVKSDNVSALDLLPLNKYNLTPLYNGVYCPFNCIFCAWGGYSHWYRDMDLVLQEALKIADNSKSSVIYFLDPNTLLNPKWAKTFAEKIGRSFKWHIDGRVDQRDPKLLKLLFYNGCIRITYGAENIEPHLKRIKKRIKQSWIYEAGVNASQVGLKAHFTFLFGFPWDNIESKNRLANFMDKLSAISPRVTVGVNYPFPHPNTELFETIKDKLVYPNLIEMYESQKFKNVPVFPTDSLTVQQVYNACMEMKYRYRIQYYLKHFSLRDLLRLRHLNIKLLLRSFIKK